MQDTIPPIQTPPQNSGISLASRGDAVIISGNSQGVPLELYTSESLSVMEKTLNVTQAFSSKSPGDNIGNILAQQIFDWSIELSDGLVTFSSGALPAACLFTLNDIRRIFRSGKGHLMVELSSIEEGNYKTQILAGELGAEDAEWLSQSLIQLFDLDENGVAKPQVQGDSHRPPTESFKVTKHAGGSRVEIKHVQKLLLHRILPLVIGAIVISLAGFMLLGGQGGGGEGLLPDIIAMARDHPVWSVVTKYLVIAVIIYIALRVGKIAFGTLEFGANQNSFEIKKGILGYGFSRSIPRSKIVGLEQSTWTERQKNEGTDQWDLVQYWGLKLQGEKSITLLTDETTPKDSDWLGQFLSNWFEVPFVKKGLPDKH